VIRKLFPTSLLEFLKNIFFIFLFAVISFCPDLIMQQGRQLFTVFLALFFILMVFNKDGLKDLRSFKYWFIGLFILSLAAGLFNAENKPLAIVTYRVFLLIFLFIFFIGERFARCESNFDTIVFVISTCSGIVALLGILELTFGKNIFYEGFIANPYYERYSKFFPRPMSTQLNPAVLGSFLLGCLPFNFYNFRNKLIYRRLLSLVFSLLTVLVILLTYSRGAFLGLVAMALFYLLASKRKKIFSSILVLVFFFILSCTWIGDPNINRFGFKRLLAGSYDSVLSEYRFKRVAMTTRILKDHPLFGIGFNHFRVKFNKYCTPEDIGQETHEFMIPDNMYLTFLSETGIIGTAGFLILVFILLKKSLKAFLKEGNKNKDHMLLISLSAWVGLLVNMGGYDLFYWNNPYVLFCLLTGFIQGLASEKPFMREVA
jgi:O-antigen ligase